VGASDFIHKPISVPIVTARVRTHLKVKLMQDYLRIENTKLLKDVGEKSTELQQLRDFMWGGEQFVKR
jgi:putative two-component system response regulator